ncbi:hypothetical protein B0T21DRAFT_344544 [Apiosordaria backusii]|uniref:Uncharacterized protein n=1 Tax=Apiosordaria backusii TaxID=314023 RepID=A0AA40ERS8_9PEZI|nr:hypothetical protein B0T21DRAFT_344544 [Apiosordaria backusii]
MHTPHLGHLTDGVNLGGNSRMQTNEACKRSWGGLCGQLNGQVHPVTAYQDACRASNDFVVENKEDGPNFTLPMVMASDPDWTGEASPFWRFPPIRYLPLPSARCDEAVKRVASRRDLTRPRTAKKYHGNLTAGRALGSRRSSARRESRLINDGSHKSISKLPKGSSRVTRSVRSQKCSNFQQTFSLLPASPLTVISTPLPLAINRAHPSHHHGFVHASAIQ